MAFYAFGEGLFIYKYRVGSYLMFSAKRAVFGSIIPPSL